MVGTRVHTAALDVKPPLTSRRWIARALCACTVLELSIDHRMLSCEIHSRALLEPRDGDGGGGSGAAFSNGRVNIPVIEGEIASARAIWSCLHEGEAVAAPEVFFHSLDREMKVLVSGHSYCFLVFKFQYILRPST